jgi:phosphoribulokinase
MMLQNDATHFECLTGAMSSLNPVWLNLVTRETEERERERDALAHAHARTLNSCKQGRRDVVQGNDDGL